LKIQIESTFAEPLLAILKNITKDKKSAAKKFKNDLKEKIDLLRDEPFMCRQSHYFQDKAYRDLTFKGYTIIYKIENETIKILDIFKWQNR